MQGKNTTKRAAKQSPTKRPTAKKRANDQRDTEHAAASAQREIDYALTSQKRIVSKKAQPPTEIRLKRFLSGRTLKNWRKAHNMSAHALAVELGVSRSYVKSIEGGSLAASQKLIARFNTLREKLGEGSAQPHHDDEARRVVSKFKLPPSFEILARPVKCKTCKHHFIPIAAKQKYCGERCAKIGRKTQRTANAQKTQRPRTRRAAKRSPVKRTAETQRRHVAPGASSNTRGGE